MQIVLIGAGRLSTNLAPALIAAGHEVVQVYSRTKEAATVLADKVNAQAVTSLTAIAVTADIYIFSVTDTALPTLIAQMPKLNSKAICLHTAGSMPLSVFNGSTEKYGVFYPMQTFSKERPVDFKQIPVFIEASDEGTFTITRQLAESISNRVIELSSEDRKYLHLAAVYASNFANHCYELSAEILQCHKLPFDVMLPLIDETAAKVHQLSPLQAQTGPAVRYDQNVMNAQKKLLYDQPRLARIYEEMSESIHCAIKNNLS